MTNENRIDAFLQRLEGVHRNGQQWSARCPAHDDKDPSLSVSVGDDGRILVHCHAGCPPERVVDAVGWKMADLLPIVGPTLRRRPQSQRKAATAAVYSSPEDAAKSLAEQLNGKVAGIYDYVDKQGAPVGAVVRIEAPSGKQIRPLRCVGNGWVIGGMDAPRPLYNLPALQSASHDVVLVVEGEKCVHIVTGLSDRRFIAVTSAGGAQAARKTDWSPLCDRKVVVLPDYDEPGRGYATDVCKLVSEAGASSVHRLELPGLPVGGDIEQWVQGRRDTGASDAEIADELEALLESAWKLPDHIHAAAAPSRPAVEHPWPDPLGPAVRTGYIAEFLDAVELQTEADPAAIVFDLLTRFGNAVGHGPHFTVSGDRHGCLLFTLIVGGTASGRKGTSSAYPRKVMGVADAEWASSRQKSGLSSGEGVIWSVRDPTETGVDKHGDPIVEPGVEDKRLLVHESEFARTMRAGARRESTLFPILRAGWEGGQLATLTKQPYEATDAHISIVGHVTPQELRSLLKDADVAGGTVNRFLMVASRRQRELPFGGEVDPDVLQQLGDTLADRIRSARVATTEIVFSSAALDAWPGMYRALLRDESAPGQRGMMLGRAVVQVRRLSMIVALINGRSEIDLIDLEAAMDLWRYCSQTISHVFGDATGNPDADRILAALRRAVPQGLDRTEISNLFHGHASSERLDDALELLRNMDLVRCEFVASGGRDREVWSLL